MYGICSIPADTVQKNTAVQIEIIAMSRQLTVAIFI